MYSIGKFARLLGVSTATLRSWDAEDKLKPALTKDNGYRYYSQEQYEQCVQGGKFDLESNMRMVLKGLVHSWINTPNVTERDVLVMIKRLVHEDDLLIKFEKEGV